MAHNTFLRWTASVIAIGLVGVLAAIAWFYGSSSLLQKFDQSESRDSPSLHQYSFKDVRKFLSQLDRLEYFPPDRVVRNSDGSAIRFISGTKGLEASCSGTLTEFKLPNSNVWLDDELHVVAWHDNGQYADFGGGIRIKQSMNPLMADPSGRFFVKHSLTPDLSERLDAPLEIRSTESPTQTLARIPQDDLNARLFTTQDELWLVVNQPSPSPHSTIHRYKVLQKRLAQIDQIEIGMPNRYIYVRDVNPVNGDVLFIERFDPPLSWLSRWHVFDYGERRLLKAGPASAYGFYLSCDLLSSPETFRALERRHS